MSAAEAQRLLVEIMLAAAIIADRMRLLSNARIQDAAEWSSLQSAVGRLTTQQVTDTINQMLESNPTALDEESARRVSEVFGNGPGQGSEPPSVRHQRVAEVLRLPPLPA